MATDRVPADPPPANPFWAFSLAVYGRTGVAAACLALQDRRGVDVNLLLLLLWAGARCGVRLTAAEVDRIAGAIAPWHRDVVVPLRAVRRRLKGDAAAEGLRERVKAVELESERLEQDRLHALAGLREAGGGSAAVALANLHLLVPGDGPEDAAALRTLVEAAAVP